VRHLIEQTSRARPAGRREPAREHALAFAEYGHRERVLPAEHLGEVRAGRDGDEHKRRLERHRAERAHRGAYVVTAITDSEQDHPGGEFGQRGPEIIVPDRSAVIVGSLTIMCHCA